VAGHRVAGSRPRVGLLGAGAALVLGTLLVAVAPTVAEAGGSGTHGPTHPKTRVVEAYATYYGWFTNTPPGCATAYSGCAHGAGTYGDPITLASDRREFRVGTILYYPTVEKYFRMGDECTDCTADWKGRGPDGGPHLHHVDLWIGGKGANAFDAVNCEDALTQGTPSGAPLLTPFVVNPPRTLPVSTEPLFDARTGHCFGGAATSAVYGRYENLAAKRCVSIGTGRAHVIAAQLEACSARAGEDIGFEGAFFVVQHRCLETRSGRIGSPIVFAVCTGGPDQQWERGPSGSIEWIQDVRCIMELGGRLELGTCSTAAADRWSFTGEAGPSRRRAT